MRPSDLSSRLPSRWKTAILLPILMVIGLLTAAQAETLWIRLVGVAVVIISAISGYRIIRGPMGAAAPDEQMTEATDEPNRTETSLHGDNLDTGPLPVVETSRRRTALDEIRDLQSHPPEPYCFRLGYTYLIWKLWKLVLAAIVCIVVMVFLRDVVSLYLLIPLALIIFLGARRYVKWRINWIMCSIENGSLVRTDTEYLIPWMLLGSEDDQIAIDGELFITPEQTIIERLFHVHRLILANPNPVAEERHKILRDIPHIGWLIAIRNYRRRLEQLSNEYGRMAVETQVENNELLRQILDALASSKAVDLGPVAEAMREIAASNADLKDTVARSGFNAVQQSSQDPTDDIRNAQDKP